MSSCVHGPAGVGDVIEGARWTYQDGEDDGDEEAEAGEDDGPMAGSCCSLDVEAGNVRRGGREGALRTVAVRRRGVACGGRLIQRGSLVPACTHGFEGGEDHHRAPGDVRPLCGRAVVRRGRLLDVVLSSVVGRRSLGLRRWAGFSAKRHDWTGRRSLGGPRPSMINDLKTGKHKNAASQGEAERSNNLIA